MTTGEGGLITTDDDALADWIRLYRNQGMRERYRHEILGYNFRLTDIAAAIGLCQLDKLERNTARRQAIAARYDEALRGPAGRRPERARRPDARLPPVHARRRAGARRHRRRPRRGRRLDRHLLPDPRPSPAVRRWRSGIRADLPVTDRAAARSLSLPMFPGLTDDDQATVIEAVRAVVGRHAATAEPMTAAGSRSASVRRASG